MSLNWQHLEWKEAQDNIPGVASIGYFAPKSIIDNFPEPVDDISDFSQIAQLESTPGFTFLSEGFYKIYGTEGTGRIDFDSQGERDSQSFINKFQFNYPGMQASAKAMCRKLNNTDAIFIGVEVDGTMVLIGHKRFRMKFRVAGTTADLRTARKGCLIEVSCTHEVPAPIYTGEILLATQASGSDITGYWDDSGIWYDSGVWND